MKRLLIISAFSLFAASCGGGGEKTGSTADVIKSNNLDQMKARREAVQAELTQLDEAIEKIDTVREEALVSVMKVQDTVFNHYVEIQGNVTTDQNIIIYPEYAGVLTQLNVKAGQRVSKGQVLGRIDDGGLGQQVAQLETQLALSKTTFDRQKRLWDQKIGSEIQYLQAKTNMESQQKAVSQAKAQLAKTIVRAPFSGTIDEIITERGQVADQQNGLMRIVSLGDMYVTATIPENYVAKVKVGTLVDVELSALGKTYKGKVRQVASNINAANRSFGIEVSVPNTDNLLRPNQVAKLKVIDYTNKASISVPSNLLLEDAKGQKYLYVAENANDKTGIAKKVVVKTGQTSGNSTEILSGLKSGDVIVTEGASGVAEGTKLNF